MSFTAMVPLLPLILLLIRLGEENLVDDVFDAGVVRGAQKQLIQLSNSAPRAIDTGEQALVRFHYKVSGIFAHRHTPAEFDLAKVGRGITHGTKVSLSAER